jgi:hypothetical protein
VTDPREPDSARGDEPFDDLDELDPEDVAAMQAELAEARRQLVAVPAEQVVANHAIGLYELAAIHLGQSPANLAAAALAIDAMGALVEGLGSRLGEATPTLTDALQQIRLAFVQVKASQA